VTIRDFNQIRSFQFQKQFLLESAPQDQYAKVLNSQIGLHCTDTLTPYLSLWARVQNFEPRSLFEDELSGRAIRIRAFRGTLFVVHKNQSEHLFGCIPLFLNPRLREAARLLTKSEINYHEIEKTIVRILSESPPLSTRQIRKVLHDQFGGDTLTLIIRRLELSGTIIRNSPRYLTDQVPHWRLPETDEENPLLDPEQALKNLTLQYIRTFGPICIDDLCWWFPITKTKATELITGLSEQLVKLDSNERTYWMEKLDYRKFKRIEPFRDDNPLITLLPYEDHFTKSYTIRNWYLSRENTSLVTFEGRIHMGQIQPSIWINGKIVGRWIWNWKDKKKTEGTAQIAELQQEPVIDAGLKDLIEIRLAELETFMNNKMVPLIKKRDNPSISQ